MFMKLTDMTHGSVYCLITLKPRDKTHYCSLYSVVLTVPDKAPFSTGTDTAHQIFHPHLPACSPNTPQLTEEMDPCWTGGQSPGETTLKVRGCKVAADECFCNIFHN